MQTRLAACLAVLLTVSSHSVATADVVDVIRKLGGSVAFDDEGTDQPITRVDLGGTDVSDDDLDELRSLDTVTDLDLGRTAIGNAGLSHLRRMSNLRTLNLAGTYVTDTGLSLWWATGDVGDDPAAPTLRRVCEVDLRA